jgi:hypothetical protein
MAFYIINTPNTSMLSNNDPLVYAGKNGFTTPIGSIPVLCNAYASNSSSIVLSIENLYSLVDDNYLAHILEVPALIGESNSFVRVPIAQYAESGSSEGASGYYSNMSNLSLEISSYNLTSNSITVVNKNTSAGSVGDLLSPAPFYVTLFQTLKANNASVDTVYVAGSKKLVRHLADVSGLTNYTFDLRVAPKFRSAISVYVDDIRINEYSWSPSNPLTLTIPSIVSGTQARVVIDNYTVPAIEQGDVVSLAVVNNTYSVVNTSYQVNSVNYDEALTANNIYKIVLDRALPDNVLSYYLINVSEDLEGHASNITSNSFTLLYPDSYPYSYNLANSSVYYIYKKDKVRYTIAKLDEYGRLSGLSPRDYIVEATTINRYNRASYTVRGLLQIEGLKLSKITDVDITERIFIDTTGGASISVTLEFNSIKDRDVTSYELLYRVVSEGSSTVPQYTRAIVNNDLNANTIRYTINNLTRGSASAVNSLNIIITPLNGELRGYPLFKSYSLLGKLANPAGLSGFNIAQQGDNIIYTWQFAQTKDGFILDLDTKEVEIREFPGFLNTLDEASIEAAWTISLTIDRIPFPNTTYTSTISKYGNYTYLIRVRDTSNNESDEIIAAEITLERTGSKVYKAYNEKDPSTPFITQDGLIFPNSNTYPEVGFPSFGDSLYNGFVYVDSTNVDNANGSSLGFSSDIADPSTISSTDQALAEYTTQIRDVGKVIRGTIRINPVITILSITTFNDQYRVIQSGISDYHLSDNLAINSSILVDNAFGGIGHILGFNNSNAAVATYNAYARTLTSGGASGNVFAIRNPGQFAGDFANANTYALIAGVINDNAIQLGEVFFANGISSSQNTFANVAISGNAYELVDLAQYVDTSGTLTYLGPNRDIVQNVYIKYATDNVYYTAEANGVVGFPGHGNTNPNAFVGASKDANLGLKNYIAGELDFRYFQIKLEYSNKNPGITSIVLEDFTYEIDVQEKTFTAVKQIDSVTGSFIDYEFIKFVESPKITASIYNQDGAYSISISNTSSIGCNVQVYQSNTGIAVSGVNVSVAAIGI